MGIYIVPLAFAVKASLLGLCSSCNSFVSLPYKLLAEDRFTLKKTQSGKTKLFGYFSHTGKILRFFFIGYTEEKVEEDEEKYKECVYSQMSRRSSAVWGLLITAYCNIPQYFFILPSPALRY